MDIIGTDIIGRAGQNLTAGELRTLVAIADGLTPSQINTQLNTSTQQIRDTESQIKAKLGAKSKTHMISRGFILGVLMPSALCLFLSIMAALASPDDSIRLRRQTHARSTRIAQTHRVGGSSQYS